METRPHPALPLLPIRLPPGADLRRALETIARERFGGAAFVVAGIGSLMDARLRLAGESGERILAGPIELVSLSGSLSDQGGHLHMAVSDAAGAVFGGHVAYGNLIRTTAEILVAPLVEWSLTREPDPATGYDELVVRPRP